MKILNSTNKITLVLLIFVLTFSNIHANPLLNKINQREIKIIKQKTNQSENEDSQRNLQGSTIRFSYDDQELREYNNTLHTKIILNALKVAFNFYEQFVQVKNPILDELEVQNCYFGDLPIQFKKTIKNSDMHFILGLTLDIKEEWIAKAGACSLLYPDNRPVVGFIIYNLKFLPSQDKVSFSNFEYDKLIKVTIHEIFHALVFSESLYKYYVNITPDQYGINKDGKPFLALPEILSFAQQHFRCNQINQVYLEGSGQQGTAGSHWSKSLFYQDLMTGYILAGDVTWSGINNALLKDSGWYEVQMDFHDRLFWGKNQGCDFYFKTCNAQPRPKEFCDLSNNQQPKTGFNYEGYNFQCQQTLLDKECGFQISLDNKSCYGRVDKFNSEENIMENAGSSFDWNSKGITSNLSPFGSVPFTDAYQAQCYPQKCIQNGNKMSIELTIGSKINKIQKVICEEDGQILKVEGYNGELVCPQINDFCEQQFNCKNHCSGRGFCMNQKCICAKGYSGDDCSIINFDEIQVLDILDPFCTIYNDKNECIKCSEQFSLIGNQCQMSTSSQILLIKYVLIGLYLILF
ncbi:leishmanolysin family protein (macronuclear) [Tetrahymena thermophila SB210]|uniref:Leishmanolysin family protein n=1 Tax=Tetrahymena thermophila (strain SB210) TaxID=312017 RepID=W7XFP3_TETTS|nr:leishmanolysin family protein [Tetrahymena thermophila SB210]EWS72831.1 leishmanolysin family protein [Tetrahymena thermophila SB210]|eukprot:XP_012654622.1 leishmanolysin family protein [Tetrahymena thermophila SB210]